MKWSSRRFIPSTKKGGQLYSCSWPTLHLRSTYDLLPTPTNLKQWGIIDDDTCSACNKTRGIVEHVLAVCGSSLQKYTWRHNKVLQVLADTIETQCTRINRTSAKEEPNQVINFHREGEQPQQPAVKNN